MSISKSYEDTPQKDLNKLKDRRACRLFTKVVIRRLPPDMDKKTLMEQISPIPNYDYFYLIRGDNSLGEYTFSRAYINFTNLEDVFCFKEKFDNYVFLDQKGHEYPAVVEFAAFQKIPKSRRNRPDPKCGTIESDPYYQEFIESLKEQPKAEINPEYSYQFSSENKSDLTTPLLEYVKQKKVDKQRIREERRDERRRKEIERKKNRDGEKRKYSEERGKIGVKSYVSQSGKSYLNSEPKINEAATDNNEEICESGDINKRKDEVKKFNTSKKFFGPDKNKTSHYSDSKDLKTRREEYKEWGTYKKTEPSRRFPLETDKSNPRKVKKYSAIREERKNEFKKQEQKKIEEKIESNKNCECSSEQKETTVSESIKSSYSDKNENVSSDNSERSKTFKEFDLKEREFKNINKENDPRTQRRIRNKDRPTMALYQPGMLSKRRQNDTSFGETVKLNSDGENKSTDKEKV